MSRLPLREIRIRTKRLELRLPDLDLLEDLATLAAGGIHPPETMPFGVPWTDQPSPHLEWSTFQYHLLQLATWKPEAWSFNPVTLQGGRVIGTQGIVATDFGVARVFRTGSWLGRPHQGQGLGREMRAAILHFGFAGLGAEQALSGAFSDNHASLRVSSSLGYQENGRTLVARRGEPAEHIELRLTREQWERTDRPEVELEGLDGCRELFGL
ncbi:MAG TPA: GNAT family N-acetyltransferase [Candidatus Dormibacteraeota bacterium]